MEVQRKPPHLLATHITNTPKISGEQFEHTKLFLLQNLDIYDMQKIGTLQALLADCNLDVWNQLRNILCNLKKTKLGHILQPKWEQN